MKEENCKLCGYEIEKNTTHAGTCNSCIYSKREPTKKITALTKENV